MHPSARRDAHANHALSARADLSLTVPPSRSHSVITTDTKARGAKTCYSASQGVLQMEGCCYAPSRISRQKPLWTHIDLVGEGDQPWTIDVVIVITVAMLVVSFACALAAHLLP